MKRLQCIRLLMIFSILLTGCKSAIPANQPHTVVVKVVDAGGRPVPDVLVRRALLISTDERLDVCTDSSGRAVIVYPYMLLGQPLLMPLYKAGVPAGSLQITFPAGRTELDATARLNFRTEFDEQGHLLKEVPQTPTAN